MAKAHFRTGKDQYEIVLDAIVEAELEVGTICSYNTTDKKLTKASSASVGAYIVAQSDQTMEYGHIPVENRNYAYSSKVAASTVAKKVAVFRINDVADVITVS